ncbi:substrate-binding periplasmic protein [Pseudomonas sp. MBLB4136]|uniref:substrate-binding periplasmic protein n=1 Tax=Pseudomonas sp. MBLB4136 TaxID=3451558 RepID=UPI003F74EDE1
MRGRVLCSGLLSLCLCGAVWAGVDKVSLVTGDDYAPFTGRALPGGGLLTQLVQAALASQGVTSTLDWRPWNRGYRMTLQGAYDATFPYVRTDERAADYLYSDALINVSQHIFGPSGVELEADRPESLTGKRLCYPLGWQPPAVIQRLLEQGHLSLHAPVGLNACARLVLLGRDDFFIANLPLGEAALRATGEPERFRRSQQSFGSSSLHLIVPRRHPQARHILQRLNAGLARLHERNEYGPMLERYLQQRHEQAGL